MIKNRLFLAAVDVYDSKTEESYKYYIIIAAQSHADAMKRIEDDHYPEIEDIMSVKLEMIGEEDTDIAIFFNEDVYKELRGEK